MSSLTYAHLYVDGGSTQLLIPGSLTNITPLTSLVTAGESSTQMGNQGAVITAASSKVTVKKGIYHIGFDMSAYTDVTSELMDITAKLYTDNATPETFAAAAGFSARASFGEVDAYGFLGFGGIFEVTADRCDLKVYVQSTAPSSEESSSSGSMSSSSSSRSNSSSSSESGETSSSQSPLYQAESISLYVVHASLTIVKIY